MSNVHIRMVEDSSGDLVDLIYFHHSCSPSDVDGWPAPESVDIPVYCGDPSAIPDTQDAGCGERIEEVPLTLYGHIEYEGHEWSETVRLSRLTGNPVRYCLFPGCEYFTIDLDDEEE